MRQRSSLAGNSLECFSKHQPFICLWYALIGRSFAGGPNRIILHLTALYRPASSCSIRREMKESERFVTHFLQNLTILPASLFLQAAHSHFRGGTFACGQNKDFGASDFGHRGQSAPDLAKKSVSFGFLDRPQLDLSSSLDDTHQVHSRLRMKEGST